MQLLWVENHDVFARIACRQFLASHEVTVVPSLAAALESLSARTFDAVLVDYDLDDGKGATLVSHIRQINQRMVVIATSSHSDGNSALLAAGADAACSKMQFAKFDEVLESVLTKRK